MRDVNEAEYWSKKYEVNTLKNGKVYLLDEPEVSLSPKYQVDLAETIKVMS